jgi:D-amino peptidase
VKKIFVSIDMEGIGGVVATPQVEELGSSLYEEARRLMAGEANAVIEGVNKAGGLAVIGDSHWKMLNIPIELLKGNFQLACGEDRMLSMLGGLDETYDGVMFVGYHARFGAPYAIMDHTYSPTVLYRLRINGKEVGEAELNAAIAGHYNIPVLMVAGDSTTTEAARAVFGENLATVATKKALGRFSAICEPPEKVRKELARTAYAAVKSIKKYGCLYQVKPPIEFEYTWNSTAMAEACSWMPQAQRTAERMTTHTCDNYIDAFKGFIVQISMAHTVATPGYL